MLGKTKPQSMPWAGFARFHLLLALAMLGGASCTSVPTEPPDDETGLPEPDPRVHLAIIRFVSVGGVPEPVIYAGHSRLIVFGTLYVNGIGYHLHASLSGDGPNLDFTMMALDRPGGGGLLGVTGHYDYVLTSVPFPPGTYTVRLRQVLAGQLQLETVREVVIP